WRSKCRRCEVTERFGVKMLSTLTKVVNHNRARPTTTLSRAVADKTGTPKVSISASVTSDTSSMVTALRTKGLVGKTYCVHAAAPTKSARAAKAAIRWGTG